MKKVVSVGRKVVSVVTSPFRAIGRSLPRILRALPKMMRSLRHLRTPFVKLAQLRGRTRIVVYAVLGVVLVIVVLILKPEPNQDEQVRETLDRYAQATREKDYQGLCDDLYATDLVERIRSAGLPCEVALRTGLEDRQNPQLRVLAVEVNGDQALARVRSTAAGEVPSVDTVRLLKEGEGWRVASLSEPGSASATP